MWLFLTGLFAVIHNDDRSERWKGELAEALAALSTIYWEHVLYPQVCEGGAITTISNTLDISSAETLAERERGAGDNRCRGSRI